MSSTLSHFVDRTTQKANNVRLLKGYHTFWKGDVRQEYVTVKDSDGWSQYLAMEDWTLFSFLTCIIKSRTILCCMAVEQMTD